MTPSADERPRSTRPRVVRLFTLLAAALALAAPQAGAQGALSARLLQVEDARELSTGAQAVLSEGLKSPDARLRVQAVRAAGRFESPALLGQILPLLADADSNVRQAAAVASANAARIFPTQAIDALVQALPTAASADWAVFAASLGRVAMATPEQYRQVEQAIAAGLPAVESVAQAARPRARSAVAVDAVKVEGAARSLEALTRVNVKLGQPSADTRSRLTALVETPDPPGRGTLARARRLALQALRNARAVDGALALVASKDADDEVRRLAVGAVAAAAAPEAAPIADGEREALLTAGLKDAEPRVRLEALRGWGRHFQAANCQPVLTAVTDTSAHVALQALDLLGSGCPSSPEALAVLNQQAEALPPSGATWHRAAHAAVSLAKVSPADVRTVLPRFVGHPTWQVRMYAARAAAQAGTVEALVRLGSDAHDNVREVALAELTRLKRPEVLPLAYDALARSDYQLVMTAARALEAETDTPRATAALLTALLRLTISGRDTSRDPRMAILTRLAETGGAGDASSLTPFLRDRDPQVAGLAAKAITRWTGTSREASPTRRPMPAPDPTALDAVRGKHLRITMARGGALELRLLVDVAPATVLRVTGLARQGYYDGLTFHRVEPTFVLQGGSPGANEYMGDGPYMRDEPGVAHDRGTVGISTRGRDTGDAQIFVNLVDSPRLDHQYTVFAVVERGMDLADQILEGDVMTRVELVDGPRP